MPQGMIGSISQGMQGNPRMSLYQNAFQNSGMSMRRESYMPNGSTAGRRMTKGMSVLVREMDKLEREEKRKKELEDYRKELEMQYMKKEIDDQATKASDFGKKYIEEKEEEFIKEKERILEQKRQKEMEERKKQLATQDWENKKKKVFNKLKVFLLAVKYLGEAGKSYRKKNIDKKQNFVNESKNIYGEKIQPIIPQFFKALEMSLKPLYSCKKKQFVIIDNKFILTLYDLEPVKPKVVQTNNAYILVI